MLRLVLMPVGVCHEKTSVIQTWREQFVVAFSFHFTPAVWIRGVTSKKRGRNRESTKLRFLPTLLSCNT